MTETPPPPQPPGEPHPTAPLPPAAGGTRTDPGPDPGQDTGPRVTRDEVRDLGRLVRTTGPDRKIAGVAGGLGRHLDVDPVVLRVALVVLAFFGGAGLVVYLGLWLLLPDDRSTSAPLGLDQRSRGIGVVVLGAVAAVVLLGSGLGDGLVPLPLVVLAGLVALVLVQLGKRRLPPAPPPAWYQPPGGPSTPPQAGWHPGTDPAAGPTGSDTGDDTGGYTGGYAPTSPYAAPPVPPAAWTAPLPPLPPPPPRPRKPGPILFWFTLALCALGLGVLATIDVAGLDVPGSAYPALVVGVVGVVLLLGSVWGRPGGLVAVGLLATVALVAAVAVEQVDDDRLVVRPTTAAEVRSSYRLDAGELVLDLRRVTDPQALLGREVDLDVDVGRIEVLLPTGLAVSADADVSGPGAASVLGSQVGGIDVSTSAGSVVGAQPALRLTTSIDVGEIRVAQTTTDGSTR